MSSVSAHGDISQNAELELSSSGLTELDLGADEVFIVTPAASATGLPVCPHTVRSSSMKTTVICKGAKLCLNTRETRTSLPDGGA